MTTEFYLRPGDVIAYAGTICRVRSVSESWATVEVPQPRRSFHTLWGKRVDFQPAPKLDHICPDSCVPVLNRKAS